MTMNQKQLTLTELPPPAKVNLNPETFVAKV